MDEHLLPMLGSYKAAIVTKDDEEKYKQVAELASKLAVEEAAYRDVQVCLFYTLEKIEISVHILPPVTNK